eukprot:CAMPEP_0204559182 /NCGR_PEP_ID=MMETSP0661-20131031/31715_1 /ASSEMBLY_ACC=CAM_ASM_000606 /TAXON_ID=109239 /ORGANISM="Alexandrium margalefi, Strain AMGDE01CS-322" /LENGTH=366 /DNA_ID=CAMNT_0051566385 /DNA_START=65 /DNA_END=1167 /DNA_ORIENTATION=-
MGGGQGSPARATVRSRPAVLASTLGGTKRQAVLRPAPVVGVPLRVVDEGIEERIELVVAEVAHGDVVSELRTVGDVELVLLPLGRQLIPGHEPHMDAEDGAGQEEECPRVGEVHEDRQPGAPEVLLHHGEHQDEVHGDPEDADELEADEHRHELAVVEQAYAVAQPPAVVIVPADWPLVLPGLVGALGGAARLRLLLFPQLAGIAERAIRHAAERDGVQDEEGPADDRREDARDEPVQQRELQDEDEHHAQHRGDGESHGKQRPGVRSADEVLGLGWPALVAAAVRPEALVLCAILLALHVRLHNIAVGLGGLAHGEQGVRAPRLDDVSDDVVGVIMLGLGGADAGRRSQRATLAGGRVTIDGASS